MRAFLARVDAVIIQAVIAGALSFSHLHDLAEAAGQGGWKAWAYPVSVDLLLVAAWRRMREQQRAGLPAGGSRLWFLVALAASLGANIATAGLLDLAHVPALLRVVVAGWPAVAFFGGTLLAHTARTSDAADRSASTGSEVGGRCRSSPLPRSSNRQSVTRQSPSRPWSPRPIRARRPRPPRPSTSRPPSSTAPKRSPESSAPVPANPPTPTPSVPGSACPRP